MYFAVSTGMMDENDDITKGSKKKLLRSVVSFFKKGLRFLANAALNLVPIPKLWAYRHRVGW
jgi:hypothetical protein